MKDWTEKIAYFFKENGDIIAEVFTGFVATCMILACMVGCKSEQVVVKTEYNYKDSTVVHTVYDTTYVVILDTVRVEIEQSTTSEDGTTVTFIEGGGSYNAHTGEYSGVAIIKQSKKEESNSILSAEWQHKAEEWKATADSLQAEFTIVQQNDSINSEKNTADIKPKTSGWHRFLVWWFWITAILLFVKVAVWVMEKIPATKPYIIVIRKFIPFL